MEASGVGGVARGLGPQLPPVKYPHFRVTATHGQLVREDGVEADGGDGLAAVDEDIVLAHVLLTTGLGAEVEPADSSVLPAREEGVRVAGDGERVVDGARVAVVLTARSLRLPQDVRVQQRPIPRTTHDLVIAGLR